MGIAFVICWAFSEHIYRFLAVPIAEVVAPGQSVEAGMKELVFLRPTEPFSIWIKVSFVAAIFLSAPYLVLQVWFFIAPGLYRKEKSYALPFLFSSTFLFLVGGLLLTTSFSLQLWSFSSISMALPFVPW